MRVIDVPIHQIVVGERRRRDYGDIGALAKGIKRVGLLEPILVDRNGNENQFRLLAGERRLKAVQMLRWKSIPAHLREHLTEDEMRDVELEENENRKSLTERERTRTFASSKKLKENAKRAAEVLPAADKTQGGRPPKKSVPQKDVAQALGTSRQAIERAEQHVATAEVFPFMQGNNWRQSDVLRVRERLEELKPAACEQVSAIIHTAQVMDSEMACTLVENLGSKSDKERQELYELSQSTDPRKVSLALTRAAEKPPMPDPRLGILDNVLRFLNGAIKPFPDDPLTPNLIAIHHDLQKVRAAVKEVSYDATREQKGATVQ
jgi:ParB-like chromosome segregation protein Spo0J